MKVDLKKEIAAYRARRGRFDQIHVPPLQYLMVDGHGDPNEAEYAGAVSALFGLAYRLKFLSKNELGRDYVVMPLEALWWSDDMRAFTAQRDKSRWDWTAMILTPDWLTGEHLEHVRAGVDASPAASVRLETLEEGRCVQTLHVGPFDDEGPVLERMHGEVIPGLGLVMTGRHHEIYLSDVRRTDPARLRTILRQPVAMPA